MSNPKENPNEEQQAQNNKIQQEYDKYLGKLVAVVGGKENLYAPKKVKKDVITQVVEGLLKERKTALEVEIKTGLQALLDKKVTLDKELRLKKEELAKLETEKYKDFNEAAKKLFAKVDQIEEIEAEYHASLAGLGNSAEKKS